ncbi:MAG: PilT/PilU family type 4a pilus ATPase [Candidatus Hydrogenedens sp.]|nr:PilT/PilU family type 4a pilus ATPase [Candidatus Hydrogenedens sp.]
MLIGSLSTSKICDVFQTAVQSVIRDQGLPIQLQMKTKGGRMRARATNFREVVDRLRISFPMKDGATAEDLQKKMDEARLGGVIQVEDGIATITVPPFHWRQLPKLEPIDAMVEAFAKNSLRSQTWELHVDEFIDSGFNINVVIEKMRDMGGSDLHLRAGNRPYVRVDSDLEPMDLPIISADDMRNIVLALGGQSELNILETEKESSFQYHAAGIGYLRCSGYIKTGAMALAIRLIPEEPIPLSALNLPPIVASVTRKHRGLFLVCGVTGSGKSTTLAALVDEINKTRKTHIITIEDPVEFVYVDKMSLISQRMVGRDTYSFANALRGAMREDPDLILVGEMRDMDTIRAALSAAETGHMVFSTLHTTTAVDTVNRVISYFPQAERDLIRQELAYTLEAVVCQRLLKKIGGGRVPCDEILLGGVPIVRDAIIDGDLDKLLGIMENDSLMQTFDQHAVELFRAGIVARDQAVSACRDEEAFGRVMSGIKSSTGKILK